MASRNPNLETVELSCDGGSSRVADRRIQGGRRRRRRRTRLLGKSRMAREPVVAGLGARFAFFASWRFVVVVVVCFLLMLFLRLVAVASRNAKCTHLQPHPH